jgi:hypothetical protein
MKKIGKITMLAKDLFPILDDLQNFVNNPVNKEQGFDSFDKKFKSRISSYGFKYKVRKDPKALSVTYEIDAGGTELNLTLQFK